MMKINWESEMIEIDEYEFGFEEIRSVKKVNVVFSSVNISFLCVQTGLSNWKFFYDDLDAYECLIKLLAYEKGEASKNLKKYENTYSDNVMLALWDSLVCTTNHGLPGSTTGSAGGLGKPPPGAFCVSA